MKHSVLCSKGLGLDARWESSEVTVGDTDGDCERYRQFRSQQPDTSATRCKETDVVCYARKALASTCIYYLYADLCVYIRLINPYRFPACNLFLLVYIVLSLCLQKYGPSQQK